MNCLKKTKYPGKKPKAKENSLSDNNAMWQHNAVFFSTFYIKVYTDAYLNLYLFYIK